MPADSVEAQLRSALGIEDVGDIIAALQSMPTTEIAEYLTSFLGDETAAATIAEELGGAAAKKTAPGIASTESSAAVSATASATASAKPAGGSGGFYLKGKGDDLDEDPFMRAKGKKAVVASQSKCSGAVVEHPVAAAASVVGGARAVSQTKTKAKGKAATAGSLDALRSALRPGRHQCLCNARRHALVTNCLTCGKVICEQEGEGPCLFCGSDPDVPHDSDAAGHDAAAKAAADRFKSRLLEFDRTSAKRTTVIDDQEDYFAHAGSDAWLSDSEKRAAAQRQAEREAAKVTGALHRRPSQPPFTAVSHSCHPQLPRSNSRLLLAAFSPRPHSLPSRPYVASLRRQWTLAHTLPSQLPSHPHVRRSASGGSCG